MRYDNEDLNMRIQDLSDMDVWEAVEGTGKPIFYWGWVWRDVDFTRPIHLAVGPATGDKMAGFCENNKWGYPSFILTQEKSDELVELIEMAVDYPNKTTLKNVWDFMQASIPAKLGV